MNILFLIAYGTGLVISGYNLPSIKNKKTARVIAWFIFITTVVFSFIVSTAAPPLVRMLTIVVLQLMAMKVIVVVETYTTRNRLTPLQWCAFCIGWFGMRPLPFERLPSPSLPFARLLTKGVTRCALGLSLVFVAHELRSNTSLLRLFIPQFILLIGVSLVLHFGILNITTALWRYLGVDAPELFRAPYKSRSLKEFWGKRWNLAFSEMTAVIAYRPLKSVINPGSALVLSFLLSGLLHEIAISLPVGSGFGLPMAYFGIHAFAMQLETRSRIVQRMLSQPLLAHLWVLTWLIVPMPLLFHKAFIEGVLWELGRVMAGNSVG
jgi:hypothetical protein